MTTHRDLLVRRLACCAALALLLALSARGAAQEIEWRTEYAKARQEAVATGRPLLIDFYSVPCVWCDKLDKDTFRHPTIVQMLNGRFIPLKIDGKHNASLVEYLQIASYPTLVFASADGRVLGSQVGFLDAAGLKGHLDQVLAATGDPDWMLRVYAEAIRAREAGDFAKALSLLKPILEEGKGRAVHARSLQQVRELEHLVNAQALASRPPVAVPVSQARPPESSGGPALAPAIEPPSAYVSAKTTEPPPALSTTQQKLQVPNVAPVSPPLPIPSARVQQMEPEQPSQAVVAMSELSRMLKGTIGSRRGAQMLITLINRTDTPEQIRVRQAKDLLYQAQEDYQKQHYLACLDRCDMLITSYPDLSESMSAMQMASEIRKNPEWIKLACDQLGDRLSVMYLNLADTWLIRGEPQQAIFYLERVIQTAPNTRYAETAQVRLTQLQGQPLTRPADQKR